MTGTRSATQRSTRSTKAMFRGGCAITALIGSIGVITPVHAQMNFNPRDVRISSPVEQLPVQDIRISSPVTLPGAFQPQAGPTASGHAVNGNPVFTSGAGAFTPGATTSSITGLGGETVINWGLVDESGTGAISFLPEGNTLAFSGGTDFTVLNRIVPTDQTRGIRFDGTVESLVGGARGGNVWFYSPGGIIVGATGAFDVGSLILTTNAIDTSGGLGTSDAPIPFLGAANSTSAVVIEPGATLSALNNGSYVVLVAPRIVQGGVVDVNGSVAYVAAEQADLTINNGLFDITVTVGTTDANGVVHTGTTQGPVETPVPAGSGGSPPAVPDPQAIYFVTVAKNDAVTMLVSGDIGYTQAINATQEDGEIILSGGYNVSVAGGSTAPTVEFSENPVGGGEVGVQFGANNTDLTNDLTAQMTGSVDLLLNGTTLNAQQNLTLRSARSIGVNADGGGGLTVDGNLILDVSDTGAIDATPGSNGADAFAGDIRVDIGDGGSFSVTGSANLLADATGGIGTDSAGTATGGSITMLLSGTGVIDTGILLASAQAKNDIGSSIPNPLLGSDSIGGTITMTVSGGTLSATQLALDASAAAQSGSTNGASSNDATAGNIAVTVTAGVHSIDFLTLQARSEDAGSFDAMGDSIDGLATGGTLSLLIDNATLNIANNLTIDAATDGQTSTATTSSIDLTVRNNGILDITGNIDLSTFAQGGNLGVVNQAGTIDLLIDNGTVTSDNFFLNAVSLLGDFGGSSPANAAAGGSINVTATGGGSLSVTGFSGISAFSSATTASNGATGQGGDILFDANNGSLQFDDSMFVNASGVGNSNSDPSDTENRGLGTGGTITYRVRGVAGSIILDDVFADANGSVEFDVESGATEPVGEGGSGIGGQIVFDLLGGSFSAINLQAGADGFGGPGGGDQMVVTSLASPAPFTSSGNTKPLFLTNFVGRPTPLGPAGFTPFALPIDPAARGGDGTGGMITFNLNGSTATVADLTVSANGIGGSGGDGDGVLGIGAGNGGDGLGGTATFNAISGSLTVTSTLTVAATGNSTTGGSRGGFGLGSDAGSGGDGFGGTATFNLNGTSIIDASSAVVTVSTDGFGGAGGNASLTFNGATPVPAGPGGNGGNGTGGDAVFNNTTGTISFGLLTTQSIGTGGVGGSSSGITVGEAVDDGGDGGDGTGGTATINLNQDDLTSPVYTVEANGVGGSGGSGLDGGNGGNAFGGTAALNVNDAEVQFDDPTVRAIATGGNGRFSDGISGVGGNGGNATGGAARIEVSGANGSIPVSFIILESDATGGDGGSGGNTAFGAGGTAGDGGSGGDGSGGSSELVARTGGTLTINTASFTVSSTGLGGTGGSGGNIDMIGGGIAGDGGDGGVGTGGSPTLLAQGGTISANDVLLSGIGTGGDGGTGGTDFVVQIGADGNGGDGIGGNPVIEVQEGSPGIITLGATSMIGDGTGGAGTVGGASFGGRIDIIDTSTDPAGLITMASLTAQALTSSSGATSGFFMTANSGPVAVAGDVNITVGGNAEFAFDGDGQMTVGGAMTVISGATILVSHSNNSAPTNSIDVVGTFDAIAQVDFNAMAGSQISSGGATDIRAEGDAFAADLAAIGRIDLSAGQNAMLGNGTVTGGSLAVIQIAAGSDNDPTNPLYDPQYNATVTGNVSSTGNVRVFAGGNAIFQGGSVLSVNNRVEVQTGDDIIVESGATISAGLNPSIPPDPSDPFNDQAIVNLDAGGLSPSLVSPILTPISSIIVAGTLEATNTAVVLNADAIDGLGGTINASSISADVNNAPPNGVAQSDDNGLLSANCLEGNICLGTLAADNRVEIGQSGVPIQAIIEGGTVTADAILITTRSDLVIGTDGTVSTFDGSSGILFESTEGDVELRDAALTSDLLQIIASNGSLLGTGSLTSSGDVGITVAQDISATTISAGGQLTTTAGIGGGLEAQFNVPGSISVGTLTQGANVNVDISAGSDIAFGRINLPAHAIILTASNGSAFLGSNSATATSITIDAQSITFNDLDTSGAIALNASAGDITGSGPGDLNAGSSIELDATGAIATGNLSALASILADAGTSISFGDVTGRDVQFTAGTSITGDSAVSPSVTGGVDRVILTAGGTITVDTVSAFDTVDVDGTAITIGTVDSNSGNVLGTAAVDIGSLLGDSHVIEGTAVTLASVDTTGDLTATATVGDIIVGPLTAATATLDAATGVTLGDATVTGPISVNAGGAITFADVTAQDIQFTSGTSITGDRAVSPSVTGGVDRVILTAGGTITVDTVSAFDTVDVDGTAITIGTVDSGNGNILGTGAVDIGSLLGGSHVIQGTVITFGTGDLTGDLTATATAGGLTFGSLSAGGEITLTAQDLLEGDTLAAGGDTALRSANGAVVINTDIAVTGDLIASGAAILLNALGELAVTDARATNGDIDIITGGDLKVDQALSVGNIALTSTGGFVAAGNLEAGLVTVTPASTTAGGSQSPFGSVVGSPGTGDITISAATDAVITNNVNAANGLFISANSLIDIQALATGFMIETSSADINIGSTGQLGTSNLTQDILIANSSGNTLVLGGSGTAGAFSLDANEFSRIYSSGDLTIFTVATNGAGPSMIVEDLTAQVATGAGGTQDGAIGMTGTLTLATEGSMRVNGALALTGATANNTLNLFGDQAIRVNANGGNIAVTDANGGLAGRLELSAQTIVAATDSAAADIAGATVADADIRLASNDGIVRDDGFFQADGISFFVDSGIFIQNSAAGTDFDDRRGFVVGDGGISIAGTSVGITPDIAVNGIQRQSNGTVVTGIAMIAQTVLDSGSSPMSTINGCLISAPTTCGAPPPPPPPAPDTPDDPVKDLIEEEIEEQPPVQEVTTPLIETVEIFPNREGPVIDDPVTGSGNEDLWIMGSGVGGNDD